MDCKHIVIRAKMTTSDNIFRRTIKMASLVWTSLSLFVKVAPVSGQVKYTPDTERQAGTFAVTLHSWKELSFTNIVRLNTDHCETNIIRMVSFALTSQTDHWKTYLCCSSLVFFSQCSRLCLQFSFNCE